MGGVWGVEEGAGRSGAEKAGTRPLSDHHRRPLCLRTPGMTEKLRQRRAFGGERRTVAVRRLDRDAR